jgi:hypothetical protein
MSGHVSFITHNGGGCEMNEIDTLTNFKRETNRFLTKMRRTGKPMLLTVNGKAELVVQDAASYQRLIRPQDQNEAITAIKEGLADLTAGRTRPARTVLQELARKHKRIDR